MPAWSSPSLPPDPDWYLDNVLLPGGIPASGQLGAAAQWQARWHTRAARLLHARDSEAWDSEARDSNALDSVGRLACQQGFAVTLRQARDAGVDQSTGRTLLRRGDWSRHRYGTLTPLPPTTDPAEAASLAATASALARRDTVVSHRSAAVLHGLPVIRLPSSPILTTRRPTATGHRPALTLRHATLMPAEVASWFGTALTSVPRTVADLAREDRRSGLMAADAALHEGLTSLTDLWTAAHGCAGRPGSQGARWVAGFADALAESPLESLVRACLHDAALPPPELQVRIADPSDGWACRVDMLWPDQRLVLEADGRLKYRSGGDELWREKRRQKRLERLGYRVVRVLWDDIARSPAQTASRVRAALAHPPT
ncbi:MAG TPA: hypothetical protein VK816_01310 [Jatrophihabitantaceae bacterium]|jgi:hypothetical protein|nr:hypothetical protein [Jatrophihabitantaceae bacterium]